MNWPTAFILAAWLVLNLLASAAVLRSPRVPASKRLVQLALVWLLPVIGAVVCLAVLSSDPADRVSAFDRMDLGNGADGSVAPVEVPLGSGGGGCSDAGGDGGGD